MASWRSLLDADEHTSSRTDSGCSCRSSVGDRQPEERSGSRHPDMLSGEQQQSKGVPSKETQDDYRHHTHLVGLVLLLQLLPLALGILRCCCRCCCCLGVLACRL